MAFIPYIKTKYHNQKELLEQIKQDNKILRQKNDELLKNIQHLQNVIAHKEYELSNLQSTCRALESVLNDRETEFTLSPLDLTSYEDIIIIHEHITESYEKLYKMAKENNAIICNAEELAINENTKEGKQFIHHISNILLKAFNTDCTTLIDKINTSSNAHKAMKGIIKSANQINKLGATLRLSLNPEYINLQQHIAYWVYEYKKNKQLEKEILKEQNKAEKELLKTQTEQTTYLDKLRKNYEKDHNKDILNLIERIEKDLEFTNERLANNKAGFVYVVSCRDLKDGLYKIGVTRRDVETKMAELANASHSFDMEVHGYIFVDDCFKVENQLHNYFKNKRLNVINGHKEWFVTTLPEITKAFKKVCDLDIILKDNPSEEYLASKEKFDIL